VLAFVQLGMHDFISQRRLKGFCEPENNYAIYRAEVAGLQESDVYIPALGVVLKDVAAIVEAVPNVVCWLVEAGRRCALLAQRHYSQSQAPLTSHPKHKHMKMACISSPVTCASG
jgi:hypothetical protein